MKQPFEKETGRAFQISEMHKTQPDIDVENMWLKR
jgi:hypothetical protein